MGRTHSVFRDQLKHRTRPTETRRYRLLLTMGKVKLRQWGLLDLFLGIRPLALTGKGSPANFSLSKVIFWPNFIIRLMRCPSRPSAVEPFAESLVCGKDSVQVKMHSHRCRRNKYPTRPITLGVVIDSSPKDIMEIPDT